MDIPPFMLASDPMILPDFYTLSNHANKACVYHPGTNQKAKQANLQITESEKGSYYDIQTPFNVLEIPSPHLVIHFLLDEPLN